MPIQHLLYFNKKTMLLEHLHLVNMLYGNCCCRQQFRKNEKNI